MRASLLRSLSRQTRLGVEPLRENVHVQAVDPFVGTGANLVSATLVVVNGEPAGGEVDYAALHGEVLEAVRENDVAAIKPESFHPAEFESQRERQWKEIRQRLARFESLRDQLVALDPAAWHYVTQKALTEGVYTVSVTRMEETDYGHLYFNEADRLAFGLTLCAHAGVTFPVAEELMKRIQHVGPEIVAEGVSLDDAVRIKEDLTRSDTQVKIKEGIRPRKGEREPIPERVRREVWRRDGGKCVDCSSRERLEFDHIIPVSQGGSNTARNIELRCEKCNRKKAARI